MLTGVEMTERFPGYRLPPETLGLWQPDGGFLAPERCIVAYVFEAMRARGRDPRPRARAALGAARRRGRARHTDRDVYEADSLVITAGAWNDGMLDCLTASPCPSARCSRGSSRSGPSVPAGPLPGLQPDRPTRAASTAFRSTACRASRSARYHHFEESGRPRRSTSRPTPRTRRLLRDAHVALLPGRGRPDDDARRRACSPTRPTSHFLLDLHPRYPQVGYASACSGHGFKFASVIGEILADLAIDRRRRATTSICSATSASSVRASRATPRCAATRAPVAAPSCREPGSRARRASAAATACSMACAACSMRAATRRLATDPRLSIRPERDLPVPTYAASESERRRAEQDWKVWSPWG